MIPVDADGVSNLHLEWVNKDLKSFFVKYGKSEVVDSVDITVYYYTNINYQTVMVGTEDLKTIKYIRLTK